MFFERSNIGYFLAFMILGGVLGSALGNLVVKFIPQFNIITTSLTGPIGFNLEILSFSMKLNFASIIGIIFGIIVFRKI
ncbi:MAG TPA: hypothetical protein PLH88_05010 [Spirochaetota bacterium]|nr:hypothetical protein [Spirochaetota bacterium]HRU65639.1 hypothetical protein [Spirochaetota bacterium]